MAIPLVLGTSSWIWLLPLMLCLFIPVLFAVIPGIHFALQDWSRQIVPDSIWMRLNDMKFIDSRPLEATRINQWKIAMSMVAEKPLWGWGAAAFSIIYPLRAGLWYGHPHNLPLELAVSYGIIVSILINGFVFALLITSLRLGNFFTTNRIFDRAWWSASFILIAFHATDIPLFDSRINMMGWILLIGLRCTFISTEKILP